VHSVEARHRVAAVIRGFRPEVMFVPYFEDAHPDHVAGTRIVEDARFDAKLTKTDLPGDPWHAKWLFHYYATHLRIVPQPSFLMDTSGFAARKREAVLAYQSQFVVNERNRRVVEWLDAAGTYFGSRIGAETAEPFFAREPIGLTGLATLAR
jgi:LmbE family N-acetylglucosaminyl deacetylase